VSIIIQGYQLRSLLFGTQVIKKAQTPPNSGSTATLFTVSGGVVLVTTLLGRVSTALSGSTGAIALGTTATGSTLDVDGIATASVVGGAEIGSLFTPLSASGVGGALAGPLIAGSPVFLSTPIVVNTGTITVTTSVATMTGAIDWYVSYVPLDTGASVS
jgi:hypothetical protein